MSVHTEPSTPFTTKRLLGHDDGVYSIDYSPTHNKLISGSRDTTTRIWDLDTGMELAKRNHDTSVTCVAWSPSTNEDRVASGTVGGDVLVWDPNTDKELVRINTVLPVDTLSWSPDSKRLAITSYDKIVVFDSVTGKELLVVSSDVWITCISWSKDGTQLVGGTSWQSIFIWDSHTGKKVLEMRHEKRVRSVSWSGVNNKIVSCSDDDTIRVWDSGSGQELLCISNSIKTWMVGSIDWSPCGDKIISVSGAYASHRVIVWDSVTGESLDCIENMDKSGGGKVFWSPYENRFIGYGGKTIYIWTHMGIVNHVMEHHKKVFSESTHTPCNDDIENTIISYYNFSFTP